MIKVEDGKISLHGSDEELEEEFTNLLLACAGNKKLINIMSISLINANKLLEGGSVANECEDS